jgi:hypothetical protein
MYVLSNFEEKYCALNPFIFASTLPCIWHRTQFVPRRGVNFESVADPQNRETPNMLQGYGRLHLPLALYFAPHSATTTTTTATPPPLNFSSAHPSFVFLLGHRALIAALAAAAPDASEAGFIVQPIAYRSASAPSSQPQQPPAALSWSAFGDPRMTEARQKQCSNNRECSNRHSFHRNTKQDIIMFP